MQAHWLQHYSQEVYSPRADPGRKNKGNSDDVPIMPAAPLNLVCADNKSLVLINWLCFIHQISASIRN